MSLEGSQRIEQGAWDRLLRFVPYIAGLLLSVAFSHQMLNADFCLIDDHAEAQWLGKVGGTLSFHDIWPALMRTDAGSLGTGGRFTPVYWLYLEIETWLLGDRPAIYHALRILFFGLFLGVYASTARRCVELLPALLITFAIAGLGFWSNFWTYTFGVTEQIASVGISLFLIAATEIVACFVADDDFPLWAFPFASFGTMVAAGSKENFIAWLGALFLLALMIVRNKQYRALALYMSLPPLVGPLMLLYALYAAGRANNDFYGADNSTSHRILSMTEHPGFILFFGGAVILAVAYSGAALKWSRKPGPVLQRSILAFLAVVGFLVLDSVWEQFFYNGRLPSYIRYDFPFMLLPCSIVLAFAAFTRFLFRDFAWWWRRAFQVAMVLIALVCIRDAHMTFSLPQASREAVDRTSSFRHDFEELHAESAAHPDWPIILESDSPWDFEAIRVFRIWVRFFEIRNPALLRLDTIPKQSINTPFLASLVNSVRNDATGKGQSGIVPPLTDLDAVQKMNGKCIALGFHDAPSSPCDIKWIRLGKYIPDN